MRTFEKAKLYEDALRRWKTEPDKSKEPQPEGFHMTSQSDKWLARNIRNRVMEEK